MKNNPKLPEITPENIYLSRRKFLVGIGTALLGSSIIGACSSSTSNPAKPIKTPTPEKTSAENITVAPILPMVRDEFGNAATEYEAITNYNNYYEFSPIKDEIARLSASMVTSPWEVKIGGLVHNPQIFDVNTLKRKFALQERVYRLRCVEAWSMVVPWVGFPLAQLLREVDPMISANFVRFESLYSPEVMPGQKRKSYSWPYVEGLGLGEALHPLTILATGIYGKDLLPQNGAPLRLVVPWKYGFKSIKAIVKIDLVEAQPDTFWNKAIPEEYGFYANVNPSVPHPRWPQTTERRIGEGNRIKTMMQNGYAQSVEELYKSMDLIEYY
jgi:sulfoxide reductase catalytic subunit YedY